MTANSPSTSPDQSSNKEPVLLVEKDDSRRSATLTLNRPGQYNALSEELLVALQSNLDEISGDDTIKSVVIAANGKAFCAGHDLKEMRSNHDQAYHQALFKQCGKFMQTLTAMQQPVIAKVQGMATAAGCQLVAACDLAIASDDTRFAVSGINLGLFCSTPAVALSRNISRKRAFEMLITGDFINAEKAMEWGLINQAVPVDELDSSVKALCEKIASKPSVAIFTGKQMFYRQLEQELAGAYTFAGDTMACNMMDADTIEGVDAFLQKRQPVWKL